MGEALPREAFSAGVGAARRSGRERDDDGGSDLARAPQAYMPDHSSHMEPLESCTLAALEDMLGFSQR